MLTDFSIYQDSLTGVTHQYKNWSHSLFAEYLKECHFSQAGTNPLGNKDSYHKNLHGNKFLFWYWDSSEIIWPSCFRICHLFEKCHIVNLSCAEMVAKLEMQESSSASPWQQLQVLAVTAGSTKTVSELSQAGFRLHWGEGNMEQIVKIL